MKKNGKLVRRISGLLVLLLGSIALMHIYWPKQWVAYLQGPTILNDESYLSYTYNTLKNPTGIAVFDSMYESGTQYLFIADTGNHVIRAFKTTSYGSPALVTIAGTGSPGYSDGNLSTAQFNTPTGIMAEMYAMSWPDPEPSGRFIEYFKIYVNDTNNNSVRKFCFGNGVPDFQDNSGCADWTDFVTLYTVAGNPSGGFSDGSSLSARFNSMAGMSYIGGQCYIADAGNHSIRMWDEQNVSTFAGNGSYGFSDGYRTSARFDVPGKVAQDGSGNLYVTDIGNNSIREIDTSGNVSLCAGGGPTQPGIVDGHGANARFNRPTSIAYNYSDGMLYVADSLNNCIRRIDTSDNVTIYAGASDGTPGLVNGSLSQARFGNPTDIAILNNFMYISDTNNNAIRVINMNTGVVSTYLN
jgi:NHL repeat-containing protein